jgi:hypothetical protein
MSELTNLIPDPSTLGVYVCRPAATLLEDFNIGPFSKGFSSGFQIAFFPGFSAGNITCMQVFGNRAYGMISGPNNFDYPFVYDLVINEFKFVTGGQDQTKMPNTVSTTGAWNPPIMAIVGVKVLVTHPGFTGGGPGNLFFGQFNVSDPNNVSWTAGNLDGGSAIQFAVPPTAVGSFNGRAFWAVNPFIGMPGVIFSDVLVPTNCTNATQILTFDDHTPITYLAPLQLNNMVTGGIVQSLMVFKGTAAVYQVTGDSALNNLAKNALNVATGTVSPLSVAPTPKGLAFISPEGFRIIDFDGRISDPLGWDGQGKTLPFLFSGVPSRVVAASTGTTYRVTVQDTTLLNAPFVEYWFDIIRGAWSGPHTSACAAIGSYNNTFLVALRDVPAKLWQSDPFTRPSSTFVENGTQLTWRYTTSFFPDPDIMSELSMIETTITMGMDLNVNYPAAFLDPNGNALGSATVFMPAVASVATWGNFTWGAALWGQSPVALFPRPVNWSAPVVFRKAQFSIIGNSSLNVKLGALHGRYERLGYLQQGLAA